MVWFPLYNNDKERRHERVNVHYDFFQFGKVFPKSQVFLFMTYLSVPPQIANS